MRFLCEKHRPDMIGTTPEEKAQVWMLAEVILISKQQVTALCYVFEPSDSGVEPIERVREEVYRQFDKISIKLGEGPFLIGEQITYVDLLLYEVICLFDAFTEGAVFDKFTNF